jgi:hypothetical protein
VLARRPGDPVVVAVSDRQSGVDPRLLDVHVDGKRVPFGYEPAHGHVVVGVESLAAGRHRLVISISDYQEAKNMEDVARILPNTRVLRTTFVVR